MNIFKKLIRWSALALAIEFIVFFYVDRFYLKEIKTFNVKEVKLTKAEDKKKKEIEIPENAQSLSVSYDGRYVSYIIDGDVSVVNRETGKLNYVSLAQNTKATTAKWLPDRDRMYIVEKGSAFIKFSSYDAAKEENIQWEDSDGKEVVLNLSSSKYEVKEFVFSTLNNSSYVSVGGSTRSIIYRIDIEHNVKQIHDLYGKYGNIGMTQLEDDRFIYEDLSQNRLYVEGYNNKFSDGTIKSPCFLATDFDNIVYVGNRVDDKVTKVFYGKLSDSVKNWTSVTLPFGVSKDDIFITDEGAIYFNDALNGKVTELKTNKVSEYNGKFIGIHKGGIASLVDNRMVDNKLNK